MDTHESSGSILGCSASRETRKSYWLWLKSTGRSLYTSTSWQCELKDLYIADNGLVGGGQHIVPCISYIKIHAIYVVLVIGQEEGMVAGLLESLVIRAQDILALEVNKTTEENKMSEHHPDSWVIVKIKQPDQPVLYKVLGGWSGGYLDGDSWRMNSGIVKVEKNGDYFDFYGDSGSVYKCHKDANTMRMSMAGVWNQLQTAYPEYVELVGVDEIQLD